MFELILIRTNLILFTIIENLYDEGYLIFKGSLFFICDQHNNAIILEWKKYSIN